MIELIILSNRINGPKHSGLAQSVEPLPCNQEVVSSSLTLGSSRKLSNNILAYGINCIKLQMNE